MSDDDRLACLICDERLLSVSRHVGRAHGITADEYRERFAIRSGIPLDASSTRAKLSASMKAMVAAGKLDAHYAGNASRAREASRLGTMTLRQLRASGVEIPRGSPTTSHGVIAAIVAEIEAGLKVATAVKRSPVSNSTFYAGLARHADLHERFRQARQQRPE